MSVMRAENLSVSINGTALLKAASFRLRAGELTVVLGPNGAGKTTLLRAALGLIPHQGIVEILGQSRASLNAAARARAVAYLPQIRPLAWPNRVRDVVALGRFSHGAALGRLRSEDSAAVDEALRACELLGLAERAADTLSGGEAARMHCSRAFAAGSPILIADEPVAALDPRHQFRVMDLIRAYVDRGNSALVVLHDLNLSARYADHLIWMQDGRVTAQGSVDATLSPTRIHEVYGVRAKIDAMTVKLLGPA